VRPLDWALVALAVAVLIMTHVWPVGHPEPPSGMRGTVVGYADNYPPVGSPLMEIDAYMTTMQFMEATQHNFEILDRRTR